MALLGSISGSSTSTGSFGSVVAAGSTKLGTASGNTHVLSGSVTIKSPSGDALILDDNNNGANKLSWAYNGTSQYYMRRLHTDGEFPLLTAICSVPPSIILPK